MCHLTFHAEDFFIYLTQKGIGYSPNCYSKSQNHIAPSVEAARRPEMRGEWGEWGDVRAPPLLLKEEKLVWLHIWLRFQSSLVTATSAAPEAVQPLPPQVGHKHDSDATLLSTQVKPAARTVFVRTVCLCMVGVTSSTDTASPSRVVQADFRTVAELI